ncbi:MAG: 4-(cytidine 5'-diphospho)-2-C-methyl-D-erythritol kinase [Gammaproteobacteria bacterium]|nr:4-(cytidine 5'-diphospho)-2-C-methyl-D-erythritol kinase [Gammaproteobacteria bacterium]
MTETFSIPWPAPAKLNLFLHITGRREDGYHLLQTIFQFVDYCDQLYFDLRVDKQIRHLNPLPGVEPGSDLVVRAARLLQQTTACSQGADIRIEKNLPMGGGLGGGSSDAATTLLALNQLWQTGLQIEQLAALGLQLGADVPIFIYGHAAWAEGIGEQITVVNPPEPWYVIITPPVHVDTGKIFSSEQLTRDQQAIKIRDSLNGQMTNICQPLVEQLYPPVAAAIEALSAYSPARMTGTGACVFASFESQKAAQSVLEKLSPQWQGVVAKALNISPLQARLAAEQSPIKEK